MSAQADWATMLLGPDAVIGGRAGAIVRQVEESGFRVHASWIFHVDGASMRHAYETSEQTPSGTSTESVWDVFGRLYAMAPGVMLFLTHRDGRAIKRAIELKGHKRPERTLPGTIRHDQDAENVMFNLIHTPDDSLRCRAEADTLLGVHASSVLSSLTHETDHPAAIRRELLSSANLIDALPLSAGREALSYPAVACRVMLRAARCLALAPDEAEPFSPRGLEQVRVACEQLKFTLDELLNHPRAVDRLRRSQDTLQRTGLVLSRLAEPLGGAFQSALRQISELSTLHGDRSPLCVADLRGSGTYISSLEETVLRSHRQAFRPNKYIVELYT